MARGQVLRHIRRAVRGEVIAVVVVEVDTLGGS